MEENQAAAQASGDMDPDEFRRVGHELIDWVADYISNSERYPVLSQVEPGYLIRTLPEQPPVKGEPMEQIIADLDRLILPGVTHWNHPRFFAYFAISGSAPGILGELVAAALNVNAMMWRTSPAATELEQVTLKWLRDLIGLPDTFSGVVYDTASISTLCAIAAARQTVDELQVRSDGLSGPVRLRLYTSEHSHSSVDRAAITLGIGQNGVRKIPTDSEFRMNPEALDRAIAEDLADGWRPFCVTATVGTTSTTSIDPVPRIADICARRGLWLHVDAAYGGSAALLPEMKWVLEGCDRADSIVFNPHKWLFVPVDFSALFCRRMDVLRQTFSLVPEFLRSSGTGEVENFMDYGPQLGRRFRALKLWFVIRFFGVEGLSARIREHISLGKQFAEWVDSSDDFERLAPVPFSTICFRACPQALKQQLNELDEETYLDRLNEQLMEDVNRRGKVFLSHTKLNGRFTLRLAIGNIRTNLEHVRMAWSELQETLARIREETRPPEAAGV